MASPPQKNIPPQSRPSYGVKHFYETLEKSKTPNIFNLDKIQVSDEDDSSSFNKEYYKQCNTFIKKVLNFIT